MFSVVIPLWNKRRTVAATVAAVLAQSWRGFELIVVDDGSTDGSMDQLKAFDDPRIRRLVQPNAGPGAARNRGIEAARHDWIAFLDADDIWMADHLAELDRIRARHPEAGLIGTAYVSSDRKGKYRSPDLNGGSIQAISLFERFVRRQAVFCTSSAAIPRSSYSALGGFGGAQTNQDLEYWVRIALERPVVTSTRVTVVYRRWTGGISDTFQGPWRGRELRGVPDLGPCVAFLIERYPQIRSHEMRRAVDGFIDANFSVCVRHSAKIGDFRSLRAVRKLFLRPPSMVDRLLLAISWLPRPLARALYGLCVDLNALGKAAGGKWQSAGRASTIGRIDFQDGVPSE
jgi:glycosyltransferase involved in cell wall biosynthesis